MRQLKLDIADLEFAVESTRDHHLASGFEMPPPFLNLTTGEVIHPMEEDDVDELWEDENLVEISIERQPIGDYNDMTEFVDSLDDGDVKSRLARAISGSGAFRKFKDIVFDGSNVELKHAWDWFQLRRMREEIVEWLEQNDIDPQWDEDIFQAPDLPDKRAPLLEATLAFVEKVSRLPGVRRIALLGSLCTDKAIPKDVDLLVEMEDGADLTALAKARRQLSAKTMATGDSCGADVFICDPAGNYLGRACHWKTCAPGIRQACEAQHCGRRQFLYDDLHNIKLEPSVIQAPPLELWPEVVARVELPDDVEKHLVRALPRTDTET